jgi:hypothetical protein
MRDPLARVFIYKTNVRSRRNPFERDAWYTKSSASLMVQAPTHLMCSEAFALQCRLLHRVLKDLSHHMISPPLLLHHRQMRLIIVR